MHFVDKREKEKNKREKETPVWLQAKLSGNTGPPSVDGCPVLLLCTRLTAAAYENARAIIMNAPAAIQPYVSAVFEVLWSKLDRDSDLLTCCLATLGSLVAAFGTRLLEHGPELLKVVVDTLKDQTSIQKKRSLVRGLADVAQGTGAVVEPYVRYPWLLRWLLAVLLDSHEKQLVLETCRLLGVLGAPDPNMYRINQIKETVRSRRNVQQQV